jgi:hypothetical protein
MKLVKVAQIRKSTTSEVIKYGSGWTPFVKKIKIKTWRMAKSTAEEAWMI